MSEKYSFQIKEDKESEIWINCLLRGKLANINLDLPYCIGPPERNSIQIEDQKICNNEIIMYTYYKTNYVAFCSNHIAILQSYLEKLIKNRSIDNR